MCICIRKIDMINTFRIYTQLQETMDDQSAKNLAEILGNIYDDLQRTVTREDFSELKTSVRELAEAQKRTEAKVEELAEAQKRTEIKVDTTEILL